jgi:hypothetical protein
MFMPYYPYKVLEQTGKLREFQNKQKKQNDNSDDEKTD